MTTLAINEHFILTFTDDVSKGLIIQRILDRLNVQTDCSEVIGQRVKFHIYVKGLDHASSVMQQLGERLAIVAEAYKNHEMGITTPEQMQAHVKVAIG